MNSFSMSSISCKIALWQPSVFHSGCVVFPKISLFLKNFSCEMTMISAFWRMKTHFSLRLISYATDYCACATWMRGVFGFHWSGCSLCPRRISDQTKTIYCACYLSENSSLSLTCGLIWILEH